MTQFRDSFSAQTVERSGELSADVRSVKVLGPKAGILYRWRVLTRAAVNDPWIAGQTERFEAPVCVWDGE